MVCLSFLCSCLDSLAQVSYPPKPMTPVLICSLHESFTTMADSISIPVFRAEYEQRLLNGLEPSKDIVAKMLEEN